MKNLFTDRFSAFFCTVLFLLVVAVPILWQVLPKSDFSPEENRMLTSCPYLSKESLLSGEYTAALSQYLSDHLPARTSLLKIKSAAEYAALKRENNRVIAAENGYLIKRFDYTAQQQSTFWENVTAAFSICETMKASGHPSALIVAPRAFDVLSHLAPPLASESRSVWLATDKLHLSLSLKELLRQKAETGEPVWFHTDHHWTARGAFYAYCFLGDVLGYTPFPRDSFYEETVCRDFLGSSYSACLFPLQRPDTLTVFRYDRDQDFVCQDALTGESHKGFYREEALSTTQKYEYFLGGNTAHLRITQDSSHPRPTLLIIKDSYANALVPFLARHFDIEMLDLRYFRADATETLRAIQNAPQFAGALILCNADTLTADAGFSHVQAEKLQ